MSVAFEDLPPSDTLIFCYNNLDQLLDPRLLTKCAFGIWRQRGQAFCEHVFVSWMSTMRSLPPNEVNRVGERFSGNTFLTRCLALLYVAAHDLEDFIREDYRVAGKFRFPESFSDFHDKRWPEDALEDFLHQTFASLVIELIREKMVVRTVQESFPCQCVTVKSELWKLVKGEKLYRNHPASFLRGLHDGLGADLLMALIDKGLPRWYWASCLGPFNDNLLQYIIEPATDLVARDGKEEAEGRLCICLAHRFSLEELCHRNQDGRNALSYAEEFAGHFEGRRAFLFPEDGAIWIQVRDVIKQEMETHARAFQGNLLALVELTRSVRAGLGGNLALLRVLVLLLSGLCLIGCAIMRLQVMTTLLNRLPHLKSKCGNEQQLLERTG